MIACDAFVQSHWVDVVIASPASRGTKLSQGRRAFRPSSFPRRRESSTGRDAGAYDLVAPGVPARHFPDPGSESGETLRFT